MTLIEALKDCLDKNGAPMPDRDLACAVFAVDPAGSYFERAKVCAQSTLSHGTKKGRWDRLADGRYTLKKEEYIDQHPAAARAL